MVLTHEAVITQEEARQDALANEQSAERGRRLYRQRRQATKRATRGKERALALHVALAALDPDSDAGAEFTGELEELELELASLRREIPAQLAAEALAHVDADGDVFYPYSAEDLLAWADRAEEMGCTRPKYGESQLLQLAHLLEVPNAPFRERLEALRDASDETVTIVAERVGMVCNGKPDVSHVKRLLGMEPNGTSLTVFIPYDLGVAFMRALQMTPREAGV